MLILSVGSNGLQVYDRGQLIAYPAGSPDKPVYVWSLIYQASKLHEAAQPCLISKQSVPI